jgi:hypothetical protein
MRQNNKNSQTMKKLSRCLPLAMLLVSCGGGKTYTVEVQNQSAKGFDSVKVFIDTAPGEQPAASFGPLKPGQAMPPLTVGEIFGGHHQKMSGTAIFYAADTMIRNNAPYNGGMNVNGHYKVTIDSSLQVKWAEWK